MENKGHALEEQPDGTITPVEITFLNDVSKTTSELMDKEIGTFLSLEGVTVDLLKDPEVSKRGTFERHPDGTVYFIWDGKKVLKLNPPSTDESVLTFDCDRLYLLDSKQAAETFTDERLSPRPREERQGKMSACDIDEFYNATLGIPYVPEVVTINVLVHGVIQEWTAYPFDNKDPETMTVKNHHDYASDVSLVFSVKTRELVDFRKNSFLSKAKWVD